MKLSNKDIEDVNKNIKHRNINDIKKDIKEISHEKLLELFNSHEIPAIDQVFLLKHLDKHFTISELTTHFEVSLPWLLEESNEVTSKQSCSIHKLSDLMLLENFLQNAREKKWQPTVILPLYHSTSTQKNDEKTPDFNSRPLLVKLNKMLIGIGFTTYQQWDIELSIDIQTLIHICKTHAIPYSTQNMTEATFLSLLQRKMIPAAGVVNGS